MNHERGATRHHMPFQTWMKHVDQELIYIVGVDSVSLGKSGDGPWDMFNRGETVKFTADKLIDRYFNA
ncbi:MAG: hypothetical protein KAJ19_17560 [Gammaproteobacteria bacterium]|nr:hypothetical protein [Gammaproteobacteria bacterium]